jgi:hypothetical protein
MGALVKKAIISLILLLSFAAPAVALAPDALRPDAPERHVVAPGDTLWGIAARFLQDPWRWPELWKMNHDQIRNPHRIYPGDVLVLERTGGGDVRLRLATDRLSPRARVDALDAEAIHSIPPSVLEPFLSKPMVVTQDEFKGAPRIVATEEDRVVLGAGNIAYVEGIPTEAGDRWQIYRRGGPLVDPEGRQTLGFEAIYLGEARLRAQGEVSTVEITRSAQEIRRDDRLVPVPRVPPVFAYVPRAPDRPVRARIVSTYNGLWETGPLAIVSISKGSRDGLEIGHVLALHRDQRSARYTQRTEPVFGRVGPSGSDGRIAYYPPHDSPRDSPIFASSAPPVREADFAKLPAERYGLIMVFRTFERVSYAVVLQAGRPVNVADFLENP